jgi:hypothetical protein
MKKEIAKAPHYFMVHFTESFTSVNDAMASGKPYVIICDDVPTNVYGFHSEDEAKAFDPTKLRSLLRGAREKRELWEATSEAELLENIAKDQRVLDKVYTLSDDALYGAIENLPTCERMHLDASGDLHCGNPEGESCFGGCVLQGYDQDEEFSNGFKCPMHEYWSKRYNESRKKLAVA